MTLNNATSHLFEALNVALNLLAYHDYNACNTTFLRHDLPFNRGN